MNAHAHVQHKDQDTVTHQARLPQVQPAARVNDHPRQPGPLLPRALTARKVLQMQRTLGNHATGRLVALLVQRQRQAAPATLQWQEMEHEADVMGARVRQITSVPTVDGQSEQAAGARPQVVQRVNGGAGAAEGAGTAREKLAKVREMVDGMEFTYGQGSDCRRLAEDSVTWAVAQGYNATLKREDTRNLRAAGRIKGTDRESNTAEMPMWYFQEHFWCEIEGIEYDPLFGTTGSPPMQSDPETTTYRDWYIFEFKDGKAVVEQGAPEGRQASVFKNKKQAQQFVDTMTPGYTSDTETESVRSV